jgi:hypothetical protein
MKSLKRYLSVTFKCLIFLSAVALFYLAYLIAELRKYGNAEYSVNFGYCKFLITMLIMLTGLVAHFMLRGMFDDMDTIAKTGLTLLHYVVPISAFLAVGYLGVAVDHRMKKLAQHHYSR